MFDATLTDIEFVKDFENKDADWLRAAKKNEPDLEIDGLNGSFFWRLIGRFQRPG